MGTQPQTSWLRPMHILAICCAINTWLYMDRGVISSNGVNGAVASDSAAGYGVMGAFNLSLLQDGLLPAAFMVGLLLSSPIFAEAVKHVNSFRLIAIGLAIWTLAVAGCGVAQGFVSLLLCRMAVGVGEASFVAIASAVIDDVAPPAAKTRWLAAFYLCIPTGYAAGYILGGLVAGPLGWRAAFFIEAAAMVPFVLMLLLGQGMDIKGKTADGRQRAGWRVGLQGMLLDVRTVWRHRVYALTVAGTAFYTAVLGAFAYYGPKAGRDVFGLDPADADLTFGAITVGTGVLGTLAGGFVLDAIGSTMPHALLLCAAGTAAGCLFLALSFVATRSFAAFAPIFAMGQLGLFFIGAPQNAVVLWAVPPLLRPLSMSMLIIVIHVLGDVPSPPALGWLQGRLHDWRLSMALCSLLLLLASACYLAGMWVARRAPDYRQVNCSAEPEHQRPDDEQRPADIDGHEPLLQEQSNEPV